MEKEEPKKPSKRKRAQLRLGELLASLVPEHFGDFFFLTIIVALALGATVFWFFAWLPSTESVSIDTEASLPAFSDEELEKIIGILESRTEASTAPVLPPTRDPFK
jgi:hypothetical protein